MRGRDSILLRFTSRPANSWSTSTSEPGESARPQKTIEVLKRRSSGHDPSGGLPPDGLLRRRARRSGSRSPPGPRRRPPAPRIRTALPPAAVPSAAHGSSELGHDAHGVRGAGGGHHLRAAQSLAQEAGALAACLWVGDDPVDLLQGHAPAGDQAVADRVHHLADDPDLVGLEHERVERRVDRSLDGVLDRHQRALARLRPRPPSRSRRSSAAAPARARRAATRSSEASRASSLKVPSGPRKATRTVRLPGCGLGGGRRAEASWPRRRRRRPSAVLTASSSSGESSTSGVPVAHALHVQARLVAVQDRGQHHAGALLVEQRHRAGLAPAHLVVGVVADHRRAADAAGDPGLVALEPAAAPARRSTRPARAAPRRRSRCPRRG